MVVLKKGQFGILTLVYENKNAPVHKHAYQIHEANTVSKRRQMHQCATV